ncbi:MAG TPA: NAD(P)-dependent oxidoreductase [Chromatiales bacterium]|nr:NAD(P)-dependent oxidoreductase [Thiotrichales bacterium]HIP68104.1 NAD(P)-dependent oxidoreductase [Chromatiales bacterium]
MQQQTNIGVIGTGFIAKGLVRALEHHPDLQTVAALTRRDVAHCPDFPRQDILTQSIDELIEKSDLVVECSGDVVYATDSINKIMQTGLPVVTMNSEFHVTTGSWFVNKGYITEAEGDQPGSTAALHKEAVSMGFRPLVYGNVKGFLNHHPTPEDMHYWAEKQGISVKQTTSFTDGTKMQIEQAFAANGLGATIAQQGLTGPQVDSIEDAAPTLIELAKKTGRPIADYVIATGKQPAVFIIAEHDNIEQGPLQYFKLGEGPHYVLPKAYHLCFFEIPRTIERVLYNQKPLLTNSAQPEISMASIAKRPLKKGEKLDYAIGSFDIRGEAIKVAENKGHVPIGILEKFVVRENIEPGQIITFADVDIPDSLALNITKELFA